MGDCDALARALLACGVADTIAAASASFSGCGGSKQNHNPWALIINNSPRGVIHRYTTMYTSFKTTIQLSYE